MPFSVFWELTLSACITVWSPGPNNILLLSSSSQYGFRKNLKFMAGIWTGSLILMLSSGFFCRALENLIPGIQPVMKWAGAAYLFYLAFKTFRRKPPKENSMEQEPSYPMGIFLQLINVKIIIYGLTMFSSFILLYETRPFMLALFAFYLMFLGAVGNLLWAAAGSFLKRFYQAHYQGMNLVMGTLLLWCVLRILGVF